MAYDVVNNEKGIQRLQLMISVDRWTERLRHFTNTEEDNIK